MVCKKYLSVDYIGEDVDGDGKEFKWDESNAPEIPAEFLEEYNRMK